MLRQAIVIGVLGILPATSSGCPCCWAVASEDQPAKSAAFGAETRAATAEEATAFGLARDHGRPNGQVITGVDESGAAHKAGLAVGDVLLAFGDNKFFSRDDLDDFLGVSRPGDKVQAVVKRAGTFKEETLTVTLGVGPAIDDGKFTWQYAGTAQLESALAVAKKKGKLMLVGLSGAET